MTSKSYVKAYGLSWTAEWYLDCECFRASVLLVLSLRSAVHTRQPTHVHSNHMVGRVWLPSDSDKQLPRICMHKQQSALAMPSMHL